MLCNGVASSIAVRISSLFTTNSKADVATEPTALEFVVQNDEMRAAMEDATPLHSIGEAEDVAAAVIYLASPASAYVTGKVLEVDGGLDQPNLDLGLHDL